jgi:MFS family permease
MVVAMVIATILIAGAWMAFRDGAPTLSAGPRLMLPQRAALPLCVAALLCLLCEGAMVDWSAVYLQTVAEMPSGQAAVGYAAFAATMLVGRVTGDRVVRSLGRPQVVAMGGLLAAAGSALVIILPMPLTVTVGFALVGIGMSNIVPILFSAAGRLWTSPSLGVAMVATTGYAGFLLGPVIIGAIAQSAGLRIGMWVLVGCAAIVALLANAVRAEQP